MGELTFSTHLCVNQQEMEATQADVGVLVSGLGRNIIEHLAIAELGRPIRIFIRDSEGRAVGGIAADAFGAWAFISLLWVGESLRNQGYGTELLQRLEAEALRLGCRNALVDTSVLRRDHSTRSGATRCLRHWRTVLMRGTASTS